jgi:hypothetical protein
MRSFTLAERTSAPLVPAVAGDVATTWEWAAVHAHAKGGVRAEAAQGRENASKIPTRSDGSLSHAHHQQGAGHHPPGDPGAMRPAAPH